MINTLVNYAQNPGTPLLPLDAHGYANSVMHRPTRKEVG